MPALPLPPANLRSESFLQYFREVRKLVQISQLPILFRKFSDCKNTNINGSLNGASNRKQKKSGKCRLLFSCSIALDYRLNEIFRHIRIISQQPPGILRQAVSAAAK